MHLFVIPQYPVQYRNVHISVLNGALWDRCIVGFVNLFYFMGLRRLYSSHHRLRNFDVSKTPRYPNASIIKTDSWFIRMMSSNENIIRLTGALWEETTGHGWIPLTKASDAGLWCFLWSAPEQTTEQTVQMPVIWDPMSLIVTLLES